MSYTPNNIYVFFQAFSGAVAGLLGQSTPLVSTAGYYTSTIQIAGAWAEEVDTQWGISADPDLFEYEEILTFSNDLFEVYAPRPELESVTPSTYTPSAKALIAILNDAEAYLSGQGITPPPIPTGGTSGIVSVATLAALAAVSTTDLVSGTLGFVRGGQMGQNYYSWQPADMRAPDGYIVVESTGSVAGNWVLTPDNNEGLVFVRPIDGVSDDWPSLMGIIAPAIAGKATLQLLPGYAGEAFQCLSPTIFCPSFLHLAGQPGVVIDQILTSPGTGNAAFVKRSSLGADLVLQANVPVGAKSVSVGASVPAGTHLLLQTSTGGQISEQFITETPVGGGPFTIPLDRPTMRAYPSVSSTAKAITDICQGIRIDGRGMTIVCTGGDDVFNFSVAYNCEIRDVTITGALGGAASIACLFDTGSLLCDFARVRSYVATSVGILFASCSKSNTRECDVSSATDAAILLQSCVNSDVVETNGYESNLGLLFGTSDSLTGCLACGVRGGSFNGNTSHGVYVADAAQSIDVSGVWSWSNGGSGLEIDATIAPCDGVRVRGGSYQHNTGNGITIAATVTGTVLEGPDVSNNVNAGASFAADVDATGLICRGGPCTIGVIVLGGIVTLRGLSIQSAVANYKGISVQGGICEVSGHFTCDDGVGFPAAIQTVAPCVLVVHDLTVDGAHAGTNVEGIATTAATQTVRLGERVNLSACAVTVTGPGVFNKGTVVANGAVGVPVAWPDLNPQDRVSLTMLTPGGAPSAMPAVAYTPATGFTVTSYAGDTSTYGYQVQ